MSSHVHASQGFRRWHEAEAAKHPGFAQILEPRTDGCARQIDGSAECLVRGEGLAKEVSEDLEVDVVVHGDRS